MTEPEITLDSDAAAATAATWRDYAVEVRAHGAREAMPADTLRAALGDVYSEYADAKTNEYAARRAAYERVARHAEGHADRLDGTRTIITETDDEHAARIRGIADL
ncbi:hypothetical protein [Mycolicibacterium arenosum]|uniref:ESX-1 secretion-associated protein n=1 Tax=Mycolicibacterium arenosum TaxID=2952157 RepID=A0ABT1MC92_9MYCO|nr:hypothetical protein [Mycolicibacterium sp. CAU 1645]MCP9276487.1 hypothetical protein [Mycolicibacterium sp. CAU 1645]